MSEYIQLTFAKIRQRSYEDVNKPENNYIYYKEGNDWIYKKVNAHFVSFDINLNDIKTIGETIEQFKSLNPLYILNNLSYKTI